MKGKFLALALCAFAIPLALHGEFKHQHKHETIKHEMSAQNQLDAIKAIDAMSIDELEHFNAMSTEQLTHLHTLVDNQSIIWEQVAAVHPHKKKKHKKPSLALAALHFNHNHYMRNAAFSHATWSNHRAQWRTPSPLSC